MSTKIEVLGSSRGRTDYVFSLYLTGADMDLAIPTDSDPIGQKLSVADIAEFKAGTMVQESLSKPTPEDVPLATIAAFLEGAYVTWAASRLLSVQERRRLAGYWFDGTSWSQGAV